MKENNGDKNGNQWNWKQEEREKSMNKKLVLKINQ